MSTFRFNYETSLESVESCSVPDPTGWLSLEESPWTWMQWDPLQRASAIGTGRFKWTFRLLTQQPVLCSCVRGSISANLSLFICKTGRSTFCLVSPECTFSWLISWWLAYMFKFAFFSSTFFVRAKPEMERIKAEMEFVWCSACIHLFVPKELDALKMHEDGGRLHC